MEAKPTFCRDCPMEDICLGGCKAAAEACCGSLRAEEPFLARYKDQAVIPKERLIPKLIPGD
jgi:MoaA/NifB/PqqE/SkfB family radical SAM enzyme